MEGRLLQNASDVDTFVTLEGRSMAVPGQPTGKVTVGPGHHRAMAVQVKRSLSTLTPPPPPPPVEEKREVLSRRICRWKMPGVDGVHADEPSP